MTSNQYTYSKGKRKTSVARVKLFDGGQGNVTINAKKMQDYFTPMQSETAMAPLALLEKKKDFDIEVQIEGGGKESQAGAMRHGISRALLLVDPEVRSALKAEGFLRRDARVKERKKPGLKRARRAPQFSKR